MSTPSMLIDAHQHFWHYSPDKHEWIDDDMAVIRKNFLPADLAPALEKNGITGCVAVQAEQTLRETNFLLSLAEQHRFIKGIVGWIDLRADDLKEQLAKYSGQQKLKGFRHVVQGEADPLFVLRDNFLRGIDTIGKAGYTYDILIFPHQLVSAIELVKQFPTINFVIDHLAKPYVKAGYLDGWAAGINAIGKYENCWVKLSGLVTEADYKNWNAAELQAYFNVIFSAFPTERIMFGSDWPVCLVATTYDHWVATVKNTISQFTNKEQQLIMGGNCTEFYDLTV